MNRGKTARRLTCALGLFLAAQLAAAEPVRVRRPEGRMQGFLVLQDVEGKVLASGELDQSVSGDRVTAKLSFAFLDGSVQEETTVFSQRRTFRLVSDHLVQKGRAFGRPIDLRVNALNGQVDVRTVDEDGKEKTYSERMKLPADVANGLITTLLCDLDGQAATVSMVVATPKPRLVQVKISPHGEESFALGGRSMSARRYILEIDLGGIAGVVAPIIGKQPPNTQVWMSSGEVPGFLKLEGALFQEGPIWRVQVASPVWPDDSKPKP